jgi:hypothetical protein
MIMFDKYWLLPDNYYIIEFKVLISGDNYG